MAEPSAGSNEELPTEPELIVMPGRLAVPTVPVGAEALIGQDWCAQSQVVAGQWQMVRDLAGLWEVTTVPPGQPGRAHELVGVMASAGEQLAMARSALIEAELWELRRQFPSAEAEKAGMQAAEEMCQRAMAELAAYYLLSTGHALANVTARTLALDTQLHPHLLHVLRTCCPVGSSDPKDWLSLNRDNVKALRKVARKSPTSALKTVELLTELVRDPRWQDLDKRRGAHYHRRRPQSDGVAGVPLASPWADRATR